MGGTSGAVSFPLYLISNVTFFLKRMTANGVFSSCTVCSWPLQLVTWLRSRATLQPGPVQCMLGHRLWEGVGRILFMCHYKRPKSFALLQLLSTQKDKRATAKNRFGDGTYWSLPKIYHEFYRIRFELIVTTMCQKWCFHQCWIVLLGTAKAGFTVGLKQIIIHKIKTLEMFHINLNYLSCRYGGADPGDRTMVSSVWKIT